MVPNTPNGCVPAFSLVVDAVGHQHPRSHREEGQPDHPAHHVRAEGARDPLPTAPASAWLTSVATRMPSTMGTGGGTSPPAAAREQLRLVAHFAEGDDAGGDEEGFQKSRGNEGRRIVGGAHEGTLRP